MSAVQVTKPWQNMQTSELQVALSSKAKDLKKFMEAKGATPDSTEIEIIRQKRLELEEMGGRLTELQEVEAHYKATVEQLDGADKPKTVIPFQGGNGQSGQGQPEQRGIKSLGEMFIEANEYKTYKGRHTPQTVYDVELDIDAGDALKTVMTTAAGAAVPNVRIDKVVPFAQRMPRLTDVIPITPTMDANIDYLEETTALAGTNAQVAVSENTAKFENTLAFTVRNSKVQKVATYLPVSDEQLDDVPGMRAVIDNRLTQFLLLKEEDILLTGTGTPPQMEGFLVKSGVNAIARTTESNIDMVWKLIQAIRINGFAEPDAIVMHPTNFDPIALYKDTGGTFQFNPLTEMGGVMRLWGKPVILSTAITLNTTLVGSFALFSEIRRKMGLRIEVGYSGTDFITNRRTILAEFREALLIYRATAFAKGTNMQ